MPIRWLNLRFIAIITRLHGLHWIDFKKRIDCISIINTRIERQILIENIIEMYSSVNGKLIRIEKASFYIFCCYAMFFMLKLLWQQFWSGVSDKMACVVGATPNSNREERKKVITIKQFSYLFKEIKYISSVYFATTMSFAFRRDFFFFFCSITVSC